MTFNFVEKVMCINGGNVPSPIQFYRKGFALAGTGGSPSWRDVVLSGLTALTLVNAKADGLNYLKLFGDTEQLPETYLDTVTLSGGCEQRNLPSEYTQVEFLESSGTQYIDTGIVLNSKATVTTVGQFLSLPQAATPSSIWGFMGSSSNLPRWGCATLLVSTNNRWLMDLNNTLASGTSDTDKHTFVNETDGTTTYNSFVDGNSIYATAQTVENKERYTSNTLSAYIFARNNNGTAGNFSSSRIYNYNIVQDDIEVINLIPARRNSDSVLGMYDTVTGNFLTNAGTGDFIAGADAPTPNAPVDIICNNGVLKVNRNLYSTEYHDEALSQTNGVTTSSNSGVNVSAMVDCRTIKSFKITTVSPQGSFRIFKYGTDNTFINATSTANIGGIVTVEDSVGFFRIQYNYTSFGTNTENILIYNSAYDLNEVYADGTQEVVTDSVGNTATPEMLCAVGSYKDTQEVISGGVTRNVGIKVLDGTESWQNLSGYVSIIKTALGTNSTVLPANSTDIFCTHFQVKTDTFVDGVGSGGFYINFKYDSAFTTLAQWKQFLASQYANGTPVIVVYPLATATTETVSGQSLSKSPVTQTAGAISNLGIAETSSSHTTPTPQQPLQINCNNGVIKLTANLFDKNTALADHYMWINVNQSGERPNLNYYGANAIRVKGNTKYTRSGTHGSINYFMLEDGTGTSYNDSGATITTPENAKWWYFNIGMDTSRDTMMIVEGETLPESYVPYGQITTDGTTETVEVAGNNLLDTTNIITGYRLSNLLGNTYSTVDFAVDANYYVSNLIPVEVGKTYIKNSPLADAYHRFKVYNANRVSVRISSENSITIQSGEAYIAFCGLRTELTTAHCGESLGSATAEMLLKVGTYQDVQSVIDGGVTRNVGVKVLTGDEEWNTNGTIGDNSWRFTGSGIISVSSGAEDSLCTHINRIVQTSVTSQPLRPCIRFTTSGGAQFYPTDNTMTLESWVYWLKAQYNAGTPVIIIYPLATATTETVTGQPLTTQAGTNIVEITQASMDNLGLEVSYKATI